MIRGVLPFLVIVTAQVQYTVNHHVRPMRIHRLPCAWPRAAHRRTDNQIAAECAKRAGRAPKGNDRTLVGYDLAR